MSVVSQIQTNKMCQKHLEKSLLAQKYERIIEICCLKRSIFLKHYFFWLILIYLFIVTCLNSFSSQQSAHIMWPACVPRQQRYIIYFYHTGFVRLPVYLISQCWFFACKQRPELFFFVGFRQFSCLQRMPNNGPVCVCVLYVGGWVML